MKILWAAICESLSVDQETNNVSLFNILEEVHFPEPPELITEQENMVVVPVQFVLMALFGRSDTEIGERGQARLVIALPDGTEAEADPRFEVDLESVHRARVKIDVAGIPLRGEGEYDFRIETLDQDSKWGLLFEIPLVIYFQNQE